MTLDLKVASAIFNRFANWFSSTFDFPYLFFEDQNKINSIKGEWLPTNICKKMFLHICCFAEINIFNICISHTDLALKVVFPWYIMGVHYHTTLSQRNLFQIEINFVIKRDFSVVYLMLYLIFVALFYINSGLERRKLRATPCLHYTLAVHGKELFLFPLILKHLV